MYTFCKVYSKLAAVVCLACQANLKANRRLQKKKNSHSRRLINDADKNHLLTSTFMLSAKRYVHKKLNTVSIFMVQHC